MNRKPHPFAELQTQLLALAERHPTERRPAEPDWLAQARATALERFRAGTLPTRKTENWRYTPVTPLSALRVAAPPGLALSETAAASDTLQLPGALELHFTDGVATRLPTGVPGVTLRRFGDLAEHERVRAQACLDELPDEHPFLTLNAAQLDDALWLALSPSADQPAPVIVVRHTVSGERPMPCPRLLVTLAQGATATLVEIFPLQGSTATCLNTVTQIELAAGARLTHYALQVGRGAPLHLGQLQVSQKRDSHYRLGTLAFGSPLSRSDIRIRLREPGADARLGGVYLLAGREHVDFHTVLEHEAPHCTSEETFRGIIGGEARAVFNGRIQIHRDAQKTSAELRNNNLLLTATAEVNTKPELEIYADDVKCAHGATVGQLDRLALFYCQSRGISRNDAYRMLSHAFIEEVLNTFPDPAVRDWLLSRIEPFYREVSDS